MGPRHLKLIGHCRADVACAAPALQVLAAEPKKEAMVPYIKVFQTLLRCAFCENACILVAAFRNYAFRCYRITLPVVSVDRASYTFQTLLSLSSSPLQSQSPDMM